MKTILRALLFVSFICGIITSISAQTPSDEFRSVPGRFAIKLAQGYTDYRSSAWLQVGERNLALKVYRWETEAGQFSVSYADSKTHLEEISESFLPEFRKMYLERLEAANLVKDAAISLDGHKGLELIVEAQDQRLMTRVFLVKNRLYFLTLTLNGEQRKQETIAENTFATFRLLSPAEVAARREIITKSFEPESLPQEPFIKKAKSDAEDIGLKGKVRQVFEEEEMYFGENLFGYRNALSAKTFNEHGYFVKSVSYKDDLPSAIIVYGYLNEERVAKQVFKAYRPSTIVDEDGKRKSLNTDELYAQNYKVQHKYNSTGQLEEETSVYRTAGKIKERVTYKHKDSKVETSVFEGKDKTLTKSVALMDEKNNVMEETRVIFGQSFSGSLQQITSTGTQANTGQRTQMPGNSNVYGLPSGNRNVGAVVTNSQGTVGRVYTVPSTGGTGGMPTGGGVNTGTIYVGGSSSGKQKSENKYTYTYEFDSQGNWIKRVKSEVVKKDGKMVSVPLSVTYRTVTYY